MVDNAWKILLIEDDEDDYLITWSMLSETKGRRVELTWAKSFAEGRQALQDPNYDAVLMDYNLGPESGLVLTREAVDSGYPAPIILLTGHGSYEVDLEAMQAGVTLYLSKGEINTLLLERSIRYAIERKQTEVELRQARDELEARVEKRTRALALSNKALQKAKDELEARVVERTAELIEANRGITSANIQLAALNEQLAEANEELSQLNMELEKELDERGRVESQLKRIEWLLTKKAHLGSGENLVESRRQPYGNLVELNTQRLLLDSVGEDVLQDIAADFLELLDSTALIYEKNGDYALGIFASGWCRYLNQASRNLCHTDDNRQAIASGKWICHEACWRVARAAMENRSPVDIDCDGGLRSYGVPIITHEDVVGSVMFCYGNPPTEYGALQEIAAHFQVPIEDLQRMADSHEARPTYLIDIARNRLLISARLLGALVERKKAEQALRESESKLRKMIISIQNSNRELEQFALVASHDMQEPLRKIQAFGNQLEMLTRGKLNDVEQDALQRMMNAAQRMQTMIKDLLALSRITSKGQPFCQVDMNGIANQVLNDLETRIKNSAGRVVVAPLPVIKADPVQMHQLLQNLISNALKFHLPDVPPVVRVSAEVIGTHGGNGSGQQMRLVVEDNGIGFEEHNFDLLFQPFQRLHSRSQYEGTGMGLAICQKIVQRHHGQISAQSKPGKGTRFIILLPMAEEPEAYPESSSFAR